MSERTFRWTIGTRLAVFLSVLSGFSSGTPACASTGQSMTVVPEYQNTIRYPGEAIPWAGVYSGHVGAYLIPGSTAPAAIPSSTSYRLERSAFAQPLSPVPYPDFVASRMRDAQDLLYYDVTVSGSATLNRLASFRYKVLLYSRDGPGAAVRADFENFGTLYGNSERQRAAAAEELILDTLRYEPMNPTIWNVLLDLYYDRAVAEIQLIKSQLAGLSALRLGLTAGKPDQGELVIDHEIAFYKALLKGYEEILGDYSRLFTQSLGVDVRRYDPRSEPGVVIGYYLFQQSVPIRGLNAAQFKDVDGVMKTVPDADGQSRDRELFAGYRDYVMLLGVLREYARDAAQLAQDYALRSSVAQGDLAEAGNLLDRVQQELTLGKWILEGIFPGYPPEGQDDMAGVRSALDGMGVAMGEITEVKSFLKGEVNILGFDPDFLVLIQEYPLTIPDGNRFDSYDAIIAWLTQDFSPLDMAERTYHEARNSYETYRGHADQIVNEFSEIQGTYGQDYYDIVGADPDDPFYNITNPAPGGELNLISQRIAAAEIKMASLSQRGKQLISHIARAEDFRDDAVDNKVNSIEAARASYAGAVTNEWDCIRDWNAAQAAAQATYDMVSDAASIGASAGGANPIGMITAGVGVGAVIVAGAANIAVQTTGEVQKGNAQKAIDLAQAEYDKQLSLVDVGILQNAAEERVTDLEAEYISVTIDLSEALAVFGQEAARRTNLQRRADRALRLIRENQQRVADRYYADPIHYLRAQNKVIEAEFAFREAQEWAFFAARALEYKYNKRFSHVFMSRTWQTSTLFQLRNYDELDNFFAAMSSFNLYNLGNLTGRNFNTDRLSLRDDFWPYRATLPGGEPAQYFSADGKRILSAVERFREEIRSHIDRNGMITLLLDTSNLNKTEEGAFFIGPRYDGSGCVVQQGKYLDKIEWIKINLVGSHPERMYTGGDFAYGGNTYIRTLMPPCLDMANTLERPGEFGVFPFRFFFTADNGSTWLARESQSFTPIMRFSAVSVEPPGSDYENRALKERSVAASAITLRIPAAQVDISRLEDIELYVRHFFADRIKPICGPGCPQ